ncbi:MAG: transketolase C-terminal domain-containing protein [Desulfonauticus sp.]|nr:transketolase C-terminal domain-containing protein [Desulfonauticus sp.]
MVRTSLREAFGKALLELAKEFENFYVLDADVAGGTFTHWFREKYPERFIQCGIAEQNMMAAAAGLSSLGIIPIVTCYAVFASMRAIEQARNMVAYGNFNVKIVASHVGIDVGPDGATHQAIEDLAIYRAIPNFTVISPCDDIELKAALRWMLKTKGPVYMRTGRSSVPRIHFDDYHFDLGKPDVLINRDSDIVIFTSGITVHRVLNVAKKLERRSINVDVVNIHTFKPVNPSDFYPFLKGRKFVFTVEDHNIIGGLGTLIGEMILENGICAKLIKLGIKDKFGKSGEPEELAGDFGIGEKNIEQTILKLVVNN